VNNFKGRYFQVTAKTKRSAWRDRVRYHLWQTTAKVGWLEDVFKDATNVHPGPLVCIQAKRAEAKVQRPDVIKSKYVIGMTVCDENCIEPLQPIAKRLLSEIRRRIYQDGLIGMLDKD
jgi:hypothetical protein